MKSNYLTLSIIVLIMFGCTKEPSENSIQHENVKEYSGPIIDMHLHSGLPHKIPSGTPSLCRPEPCQGNEPAIVDPDKLLERTLAVMKENNITKAFLSGVDWNVVQDWASKAPGQFISSPFILKPDSSKLKRLKEMYLSGKFQGLGEIGTQLNGLPPNDPSLEPYFELADRLDLPVLIHTLGIGPYMPHFRSSAGNPLLLEDIFIRHPKLRIYVENAGFPFTEEMIAMMYQYPQLYVDVSTITWVIPRTAFYDHLEKLIRAGLGKRIMFGSDQMVWPNKIGEAVEAINQAPFLSRSEKEDIFYNNAVRFLRLEKSE
ncbi:MAG: amidohydrolase [Bacteroidota bacterium]|nr:amidohydrolase [Bacteroidota bacterium]